MASDPVVFACRRCRVDDSATTSAPTSKTASRFGTRVARERDPRRRRGSRPVATRASARPAAVAEHFSEGIRKKTTHRVQAYKDRHYLRREFADLMPRVRFARTRPRGPPPLDPASLPRPDPDAPHAKTILELGCGVGNSAYPLLRANLDLRVTRATQPHSHRRSARNPEHDSRRLNAFVADLAVKGVANPDRPREIDGAHQSDAVTGVFFFSGAGPRRVRSRRQGVRARASKKGGAVFFRDYAVDDVKNNAEGVEGEVHAFARAA